MSEKDCLTQWWLSRHQPGCATRDAALMAAGTACTFCCATTNFTNLALFEYCVDNFQNIYTLPPSMSRSALLYLHRLNLYCISSCFFLPFICLIGLTLFLLYLCPLVIVILFLHFLTIRLFFQFIFDFAFCSDN